MCGRFECKADKGSLIQLIEQMGIPLEILEDEKGKSVNIAPTDKVLTIMKSNEKFQVRNCNWGIKFSADSPLIFNSRIETICEKKFWNNLFDRKRCLVPMTAFYEWKKENDRKVPYRIFLKNHDLFFVPALYHSDPQRNVFVSLITTTPNEFIKSIHHRMPVILTKDTALNYFANTAEDNLKNCIPFSNPELMEMEKASL